MQVGRQGGAQVQVQVAVEGGGRAFYEALQSDVFVEMPAVQPRPLHELKVPAVRGGGTSLPQRHTAVRQPLEHVLLVVTRRRFCQGRVKRVAVPHKPLQGLELPLAGHRQARAVPKRRPVLDRPIENLEVPVRSRLLNRGQAAFLVVLVGAAVAALRLPSVERHNRLPGAPSGTRSLQQLEPSVLGSVLAEPVGLQRLGPGHAGLNRPVKEHTWREAT